MQVKKSQPSGFQSAEDKKWDSIHAKRESGIAWNGAHSDASMIFSALINISFYPRNEITKKFIEEEHAKWRNHFFESRMMGAN